MVNKKSGQKTGRASISFYFQPPTIGQPPPAIEAAERSVDGTRLTDVRARSTAPHGAFAEDPTAANGQLAPPDGPVADRQGRSAHDNDDAAVQVSGKQDVSANDNGADHPPDEGVNALVAKEGDDGKATAMEVEEAGAEEAGAQLGAEGPGGAGTAGVRHFDATLGKRARHSSLIQSSGADGSLPEGGPSPKRTREVQGGQTLDDASDAGTAHGTSLMDGKGAEGVDANDGGERGQGHDDTATAGKGRHDVADEVAGLGEEGGAGALLDAPVHRPGDMTGGTMTTDDAMDEEQTPIQEEGEHNAKAATNEGKNGADVDSIETPNSDGPGGIFSTGPGPAVERSHTHTAHITPACLESGKENAADNSGEVNGADRSQRGGERPQTKNREDAGKGNTDHEARAGTTSGTSANEDTTPGGRSTTSSDSSGTRRTETATTTSGTSTSSGVSSGSGTPSGASSGASRTGRVSKGQKQTTLVTPSTKTSAESKTLWQRLSSSDAVISAADVTALLHSEDAPKPKSDVVTKMKAQAANAADKKGRFSKEEVQLYELGLRIWGAPNWFEIASIIPGRDNKQVGARGYREKTQASKKREEEPVGDDGEEDTDDTDVVIDINALLASAPTPTSAVVRKLRRQADASADKSGAFSAHETKLLRLGESIFGASKWEDIASIIPGRRPNQVGWCGRLLKKKKEKKVEVVRTHLLDEPPVGFVAEFSTDGKTCPKCGCKRKDWSYTEKKGIFYPGTDEDDDPGHCPTCYEPAFMLFVDNYVPGGEEKSPTLLIRSKWWEFYLQHQPPNADRNGGKDLLQYCNRMNFFVGLGPPAKIRGGNRYTTVKAFLDYPGDPLQKAEAGALAPVDLIGLTRDLARSQHPHLVGLGLIGKDDPLLALVPTWVSDGGTSERPEWQEQLSGTHRAYIKQITMLRAAYTKTGVKEGSLLSMLCEAGLEPDNGEVLSRFRKLRRENNTRVLCDDQRAQFIAESAYTFSFKRWAGLDVEEETWPAPSDAIAEFMRYLAEPEQRKLLKEILMHGFAQVAVVKAVIATGAIDKAQKMWKASHNNAVYANELDARVKAGTFCVPECDCHEKGLATGGLVGELHHDGQEGEEAKRTWKLPSGQTIQPSWYNDEQMDDQRKYLAALCARYHRRVTWSGGLNSENASFAMRQRLVRDMAMALHPKCFVSDEAVTDKNWSLHDRHHPFECRDFESGEKMFDTKKFEQISKLYCGIHCASWEEFKEVVFRELLLTIDLDCRYHDILHWALTPDRAGFLKKLGVYYPYKKVGDVVKLSKEDALEVEKRFGKAAEEYIDALLSGSD